MNNLIKFENWLVSKPIAHRGLHDKSKNIIENSLSAIKEAIKHNLPVEIDINLGKNGSIAVFHDSNLKRLCGVDIDIKEVPASDFKKYKLLNSQDTIISLEEALEEINGQVPILIEIKNFTMFKVLEENLIRIISDYRGQFAIQSFNPLSVNYVKSRKREWLCGQLIGNLEDEEFFFPFDYLFYLFAKYNSYKLDFCAINIDALDEAKLKNLRNKKITVLAWTIRNISQLEKARKLADNIIFEEIKLNEII